jgi:hypothetical protein
VGPMEGPMEGQMASSMVGPMVAPTQESPRWRSLHRQQR